MKNTVKGCVVEKYIQISTLFTIFESVRDKEFFFQGESHDFWEFVCVIDGIAGVLAGEQIYRLERGQAILHRPKEFHRIWSEEGTSPRIVVISFAGEIRPTLKERRMKILDCELKELRKLVREAEDIFDFEVLWAKSVRKGKQIEANLLVSRFENILMTACLRGDVEFARLESAGVANYQKIVSMLKAHLGERLTLSDIAELCELSESSVKKIFGKYAGIGLMTYFNEMKIRKAIQIMEEGASVTQAAESVGFSDPNYFSTVFKRIVGVSPKTYFSRG